MECLLAIAAAPLLTGIVRRVKAWFAGRSGPPLWQAYADAAKLLRKGTVYSTTATWAVRLGPIAAAVCTLGALLLTPAGSWRAAAAFPGDLLVLVFLLAAARFAAVLAALDTGSAFAGMGASREAGFAALAEPALLLCFASLTRSTGCLSLSDIFAVLGSHAGSGATGLLVLVAISLFGLTLAENARIPFDDPATHLELTMVHEAMVLDHGGPDLALIQLASQWKLWLFSAITAGLLVPVRTPLPVLDIAIHLAAILGVGVLVGLVESVAARLRLVRVPQILIALSLLALLSVMLAPQVAVLS